LENAIERGCALCDDGVVRINDLPPLFKKMAAASDDNDEIIEVKPTPPSPSDTQIRSAKEAAAAATMSPTGFAQPIASLKDFLREQEGAYLNRALAQTGGDKESAAQLLGVSVATLYRKLAEVESGS
jgi:DNA-binding NtrC family response regulator